MDIYASNILDHYRHPRFREELSNPDYSFHELNRSCGDDFHASIKLNEGKLSALYFQGHGCTIATAASSIIGEEAMGKEASEILTWGLEDVRKMLGIEISERRKKCALIALRALQGALRSSLEK